MRRVFLLLVFALMLQSCISYRTTHGYILERDQKAIAGQPGLDTKESVLAKFGEPSMIGTFNPNAWYYLTSVDTTRAFFKPKTKQRTIVAFYFGDDGTLSNTDNFNITDGETLHLVSRETPTRGKELNFWEQLLGNVGQLPGAGPEGQQGPPGQ